MKKPVLRNIMFAVVIAAGLSFASCRDNNRVDDNTETIDTHDSELENDLERAGEDIEHTADTIEDDIDREL